MGLQLRARNLTLQARTLDVLFFLVVATHRLPTKAPRSFAMSFPDLAAKHVTLIASVGSTNEALGREV